MLEQSVTVLPDGLAVSTVFMGDDDEPVTMWLRAHGRPFFDREAHATAVSAPAPGDGSGGARSY
jgi:hypothetical protein